MPGWHDAENRQIRALPLLCLRNMRSEGKGGVQRARITQEKIATFTSVIRGNLQDGAIPFRRAYLRALIYNIEVDNTEIRIHGRRTTLERLVMGGGTAPAGVPSFVRKWRAGRDSNFLLTIEITA